MSDLIREFFDSDMCEVTKPHHMPDEVISARIKQENIRKQFADSLEKKDLDLFEEYVRSDVLILNEEMFYAYVCGMRDLVRFASGIFM